MKRLTANDILSEMFDEIWNEFCRGRLRVAAGVRGGAGGGPGRLGEE